MLGRFDLGGIILLLHASVALKLFSSLKFCFHDAVAGNHYRPFGLRVQLVRMVKSEYRSLKRQFLQDYSKKPHDL